MFLYVPQHRIFSEDWSAVAWLIKFNFSINFALMLKKLLTYLICCVGLQLNAQDLHFSQFYNSPQLINPASVGVFNGDFRVVGNHKNQWRTVPVAYRTYAVAADARIPLKLKKDIFAAGIFLCNDKAGDGSFYNNQLGLTLGFTKRLNKDSTSFLSIGFQPALTTKGFNPSSLTSNNQFIDGNFDASISSNENYSRNKIQYLNLAAGINFLQKIGKNSSFTIGLMYAHLGKNNLSFFADNSVTSTPRYTINSTLTLGVSDRFELIPIGLYQFQNKNKELVIGSLARFIFEKRADKSRAFSIGAMQRLKDAFIVAAQLDYNRFRFGLSYDFTTSSFKNATNRLGGVELSLVYILKRFVKIKSYKVICPTFL